MLLCLNEVRPGRPEQCAPHASARGAMPVVSMKSGLEDRNNRARLRDLCGEFVAVSMKSGLEDRNNPRIPGFSVYPAKGGLNEVRPGRPEQYEAGVLICSATLVVSMKSGLEDRNNPA